MSQLEKLWNKDFWYDAEFDILYIATNICLAIKDFKERLKELDGRRIIEVWCDDYNVVEIKDHVEEEIKWCIKNGYEPAFYEDVFCL